MCHCEGLCVSGTLFSFGSWLLVGDFREGVMWLKCLFLVINLAVALRVAFRGAVCIFGRPIKVADT